MELSGIGMTGLQSLWPAQERKQPEQGAVFAAVDRMLDLSRGDSGQENVFDAYSGLNVEERDAFLQTLASLIQRGIVGTELFDIGGKPYQSMVIPRAADDITRGAHYYRRSPEPRTTREWRA